jgi:hypothetical protein
MKSYIVFLLFLLCENCLSQTFGLRIGMNKTIMDGYSGNLSIYGGGISGYAENVKTHLSFNGGFIAEVPLNPVRKRVSIESGFILKTIKKDISFRYSSFSMSRGSYVDHSGTGSIRLWYLCVPLHAKFPFRIGKAGFYYMLGPGFNLGIGGKDNGSAVKWGNSEYDNLRRIDTELSTGLALRGKKSETGILFSTSTRNLSSSAYGVYFRELLFYVRFNIPLKSQAKLKTIPNSEIQ